MAYPTVKRPSAVPTPNSFTRLDPAIPNSRSRTSSLQNRIHQISIASQFTGSPPSEEDSMQNGDIFGKSSLISGEEGTVKDIEQVESPKDVPEGFGELPIELVSLIDRFINSLNAKVYNTPPTIERLSSIFQDFYAKASSHVATHISALSTQQTRGLSPQASISYGSSQIRPPPRSSSRDTLTSANGSIPEQQMLTPQEISDRRRARRLLDKKGNALEEAVERRVCERVYKRIWRHRSTLDEVRDEKLRSRTAALAVVGIDLHDLGVDIVDSKSDIVRSGAVEDWIARARDGLLRMNDSMYPLGKLQQLAAAHKNIVDMLTAMHNSSSSADEILPTLIYSLITTPPEGINVISNLQFIQRFRGSTKIDGEAAYCLTNLEAAITFLETVDLASLRSDETPQGPSPGTLDKSSVPPQSHDGKPPARPTPATLAEPAMNQMTATASEKESPPDHLSEPERASEAQIPQESTHHRRVSNIFQPPAAALGAAGDAVLNTADQSIKGIGTALDNSFKLLFGRLGEQKAASPNPDAAETMFVPKTLDEARKLVEPKPADDESLYSETRSLAEKLEEEIGAPPKAEDSLLNAIAGRKQTPRDSSVDSKQSVKAATPESASPGNGAIESMRSFGNSINPLKGLGSMNVMRGFGRTSSSGTPTLATLGASNGRIPGTNIQRSGSPPNGFRSDIKTLPPIQRFIDAPDAQNLKISDVSELLEDYKRLTEALKTFGAF